MVREAYPRFTFRRNGDWENNNILVSLMYAEDLMDRPFISSYCDILFTAQLIRDLVAASADIVLGTDTDWVSHYRNRTQHPPSNAEKLTVKDGLVTRVSRTIDAADAYGEFVGRGEVLDRRGAGCFGSTITVAGSAVRVGSSARGASSRMP